MPVLTIQDASSSSERLRQPLVFTPRAALMIEVSGEHIQPEEELPPLDVIREDAANMVEWINDWPLKKIFKCSFVAEDVAFTLEFHRFTKWSLWAHVKDVPDDLLEDVIYALKMYIKIEEEGSLRRFWSVEQPGPNKCMLFNAKGKFSTHSLNPLRLPRRDF